jgi:protein TonB
MAMMVLGDLKFVPKEEPFRWDVSMVKPPPQPMAEPASTPSKPAPVKPTPAPVTPSTATPVVETVATQVVQTVQPIQRVETREVRQEVQEVRQVERTVERTIQTVTRSVEAVEAQPPAPQAVVHSAAVTAEASVIAATRSEAVVQTSQPAASATPAPIVAAKSIETATASVREVVEPKVVSVPPSAGPSDAPLRPVQEVALRPVPSVSRPAAKADYGWLGQALFERVSELVRYPTSARIKELKGKVVLRAVIKEDGYLKEVAVLQSSGHAELDSDAMEIVRRATPLKMKHVLGRPDIAITLPVVYELKG